MLAFRNVLLQHIATTGCSISRQGRPVKRFFDERVGLTDSLHLDNDLPFGPAQLEIRKRLLRLIERKYLVDHGPNAPHLEKLADLCELATVWIHEQE